MTQPSPLFAAALFVLVGCAHAPPSPVHAAAHPRGHDELRLHADEEGLRAVANIHGGHGPFAVAGYRIGARALEDLGLERGSFDIEVVHESPPEVQWSCIADGVQAATGASVGRLNLRRVDTTDGSTRTLLRNRRTGAEVVGTLAPAFLRRYQETPRPGLMDAGRSVMSLPDGDIFVLTAPAAAPSP